MCAIYGFLKYKGICSNGLMKKLIKNLSIAAEVRGVDATGISYIKNGNVATFKKAKPAHKVKLKFPKGTNAVIGHTRHTTQGNQKLNFNNHPFEGECADAKFALAHNGVLWNDKNLRKEHKLPETHIETDSYIAVQLVESQNKLDFESLKYMAEEISGSFMLTLLRDDNTLFLVKGDNPIALYHFEALGLYVYASTPEILNEALKKTGICGVYEEIKMYDGDILAIYPDGTREESEFMPDYSWYNNYNFSNNWYTATAEENEEEEISSLLVWFEYYGFTVEDIYLMLDGGYTTEEIWDIIEDADYIASEIAMLRRWFELDEEDKKIETNENISVNVNA